MMPPICSTSSATSSKANLSSRKRKVPSASHNLFKFFAPRTGPVPSLGPSTTSLCKKSKEEENLEWAIQESLREHQQQKEKLNGEDNEERNSTSEGKDYNDVLDDVASNQPPPPNTPPCSSMPMAPPLSCQERTSIEVTSSSKTSSKVCSARNAFSLLMSSSSADSNSAPAYLQSLSTLPRTGSGYSSASDADPLLTPSTLIKLWTQCDQIEARNKLKRGTRKKREVPFYKVLFGMPLSVDAFRFGHIEGCVGYFLSHAHSDHYAGLSSSWSAGPIYCSQTTGNLMISSLGVPKEFVHPLPYDTEWEVPQSGGVTVTLLPANHCPGSCVFLFKGPRTAYILPKPAPALGIPAAAPLPCIDPVTTKEKQWRYLHCGDFRASPALLNHPAMKGVHLDIIYLDTTYLNPRYCFPAQEEVVRECAQCVWDNLESKDRLRVEQQLREWEHAGWKICEEVSWRNIKGAKEEREEAKRRKFEEERRGMTGWLRGDLKRSETLASPDVSTDMADERAALNDGDADEEAAWRNTHAQVASRNGPIMYADRDFDEEEFGGSNLSHDNDVAEVDGQKKFKAALLDADDIAGSAFKSTKGQAASDHTLSDALQIKIEGSTKIEPQTFSPSPADGTSNTKVFQSTISPGVVGSRVLRALDFDQQANDDSRDAPDNRLSGIPFWRRLRHSKLETRSKEYVGLDQTGLVVPQRQSHLSFKRVADDANNNKSAVKMPNHKAEALVQVCNHSLSSAQGQGAPGRLLIVVGTYSIGKEKIAVSCALRLGTRIFCCSPRKYRIFSQLEDELLLQSLLTTDPTKAQVHVTNIFSVSYESLRSHLDALKKGWGMEVSRCIAFRPTGWSYSPLAGTVIPNISLAGGRAGEIANDVVSSLVASNLARERYDWKRSFRPTRDSTATIQIYGVPYSEHSSFFELTCFALSLESWDRIIPTVNVGNKASRAKMDAWIRAWKKERANRGKQSGSAAHGIPRGVVGRNMEYF